MDNPSPGPPCVVGALQPIVASPGEDVVLPCHLEPSLSLEEAVVEWSRQDPTHVQYVHVYRDHGEVTDMKTESYIRRTALFPEELKHGNISLKIRDVSPADEGSYRCFVPTLRDSTVQLIISECVLVVGQPWEDGRWSCLWTLDTCPGHHEDSLFFLEPNLRSVTERTPTGDGGTERGHVHLAGVVPLLLLLVAGSCGRSR